MVLEQRRCVTMPRLCKLNVSARGYLLFACLVARHKIRARDRPINSVYSTTCWCVCIKSSNVRCMLLAYTYKRGIGRTWVQRRTAWRESHCLRAKFDEDVIHRRGRWSFIKVTFNDDRLIVNVKFTSSRDVNCSYNAMPTNSIGWRRFQWIMYVRSSD